MTVFANNPDERQRLDLRLLQNGAVHLYFRPSVLSEDVEWLKDHGYQLDHFACSEWSTQDEMHRDFAARLDFPDYYGKNLDALNDCLTEIKVSNSGRVFVFHRYDLFTTVHPEAACGILDTIQINSWLHLLYGQRLFALVQSDDPSIEFPPLGCRPAMWNPREWLQQNRSK